MCSIFKVLNIDQCSNAPYIMCGFPYDKYGHLRIRMYITYTTSCIEKQLLTSAFYLLLYSMSLNF